MAITDFTKPTPIVVETLGLLEPGRVLDIGAGYGRNSLYLARKGWKVDAVDINKAAINAINEIGAEESLNIKTFQVGFSEFDTNQSYDAILCLMTLHFLSKPEIDAAIEWIKRHVLPGGVIIMSAFTDRNPAGTRPYLFKRNELKDYFSNWDILVYEDNVESSLLQQDTQELVTYWVTRVIAKPIAE